MIAKSVLAVFFGLILLSSAIAQNGLGPGLDLKTAVEQAIETNPLTKSADSRVKIAEAKIRESKAGRLPFVQFTQSAVQSNNPVFVFGSLLEQGRFGPANFSIDSLNDPKGLLNLRSLINAQMPIFDQRQTPARISRSRFAKQQAELMAEAARQQLRFEVIKNYYGVILGREMVKVADDASRTAEANRKRSKDMVEVGMTTDADLLAAEVEISIAAQNRLEAEGQLITTLASLNISIGDKPDLDHALSGELRERFFPAGDQDELIRQAMENRPDYQRSLLELESSRVRIKAVRDERLPRVDAFANFGYSSPYIANGSTDHTVGISLSYTLFDAGRKARVEQAAEEEALAGFERENLANQIKLDVIRSLQTFRTAEAKIKVSVKSISKAEEALRIVEDRYKNGLSTFNEVLRAGTALVRAKQDLLSNRYEYYVGFARLMLATGRLNDVSWFD